MGIDISNPIIIAILFCVVGLFFAFLTKLLIREQHPYESVDNFLSPAELAFYKVLCRAVNEDYVIFIKVRIADLVRVKRGYRGKNFWRYFNKIAAKHVDFVLCNKTALTPYCVIELDDRSHNQAGRRERDIFVDKVMEKAGLPLIHIPVKRSYTQKEIRDLLFP